MKTFRFIGMAIIAVLLCVNFTACSNDDGDEPKSSSIVGVWEYTSNNDGNGTMTFKNDGGLIWISDNDNEIISGSNYTYTLKGNELKIVWNGDDYTLGTFTIYGNNATYEYRWYSGNGNSDGTENIMQLTKL